MELKPRTYRILKTALISPFPELHEAVIQILKKASYASTGHEHCAKMLGMSRWSLWRFKKEFPNIWAKAVERKGIKIKVGKY